MANFKNVAIKAVKKAGLVLLALSKKEIYYEMKKKRDILAAGDLKSEQIIVQEIKKYFPQHDVLSEEEATEINHSEYLWVIDPIDGTINFSRNLEEYCISLALEVKGSLVLGVIYQPQTDKLYVAEKGCGAFLNNKKIKVSAESDMINMLLATDNSSSPVMRKINYQILAKVCNEVRHIRIFGSGALHLAKLAEGKIDIYYKYKKSKTNYWDYAAGALLVQEAGGKVSDFLGRPFGERSDNIVASNGKIHQKILNILNK